MTHLPLNSRTKLTTWLGLVVVACLASLAIVPVASAKQAPKNVVHRHFLKMYKVEKVVDVDEDETVDASVSCNGDDLAVDGMWKVVDVEQNDAGKRDFTVLKVYRARPDQDEDNAGLDIEDWREYDFTFKNVSEERVQMKIYVTCLGDKTAENSHQHNWNWDKFEDHAYTTPYAVLNDPSTPAPETSVTECLADEIAVSPGFNWDSGYGDIWRSRFNQIDGRSWTWGFYLRSAGDLHYGHRCLKLPSSYYSDPPTIFNHFHNNEWEFIADGFTPPFTLFKMGEVETRTRACDEHYKLMLHYFTLHPSFHTPARTTADIAAGKHLWFLGMDPRLKKRAYKVYNGDTTADQNGRLGGVCFHDRTGRRKKP